MDIYINILILFLIFNSNLAISENFIVKDDKGNNISIRVASLGDTLLASFNGKEKLYKDVVGNEGQVYKDFVIFNKQPSLWYSNTSSRLKFNVYYTLQAKQNKLMVDCAYADIHDSSTGMVINKAICGLNKELNSNYSDLIYSFSDKWIESFDQQKISVPLDIQLGKVDDITIYASYSSQEAFDTYTPEIILNYQDKSYNFGKEKVYIVYLVNNLSEVNRIDRVIDSEKLLIKSYYKDQLSELLDQKNSTLCSDNELSYFSCTTENNKKISICVSKKENYPMISYKYGKPNKIELIYPQQEQSNNDLFKYNHYLRYQTDYFRVVFVNNGYEYEIYRNYDGETLSKVVAGVNVSKLKSIKKYNNNCNIIQIDNIQELSKYLKCDEEYAFGCNTVEVL